MTQAEYIAALRAKLAEVVEWDFTAVYYDLEGEPLDTDGIEALLAIEPDDTPELDFDRCLDLEIIPAVKEYRIIAGVGLKAALDGIIALGRDNPQSFLASELRGTKRL